MIWTLFEVLAHPKGWAIRFEDGEIWIEEISVLNAHGIGVRGSGRAG